MYFTRLSLLRSASEFDYGALSVYKKLALVRMRSLRPRMDPAAWTSFKRRADVDPRILFVCGDSDDDPIDKLVDDLCMHLGKELADNRDAAAIAVIDVADIVAPGAQFVTTKWVLIEPEAEGPSAGEPAEPFRGQYSAEGYALIEAVAKVRETASAPLEVVKLLKLLSAVWAVTRAGGQPGLK